MKARRAAPSLPVEAGGRPGPATSARGRMRRRAEGSTGRGSERPRVRPSALPPLLGPCSPGLSEAPTRDPGGGGEEREADRRERPSVECGGTNLAGRPLERSTATERRT